MAIRRMDHSTLRVRDLDETLDWYTSGVGLTVLSNDGKTALLSCNGGTHPDLWLEVGGTGVGSFAFGVDDVEDLEKIESALASESIAFERRNDTGRPDIGAVTRFALPSGQTIEFAVGTGGYEAGITLDAPSVDRLSPLDIDHIGLTTQDVKGLLDFLNVVLGFKKSDGMELGGNWQAAWSRSGQLHHDISIAFYPEPSASLHHLALLIEDTGHQGRIADSLLALGHRIEFGPGRHGGGGSNLFMYAKDPSGNRIEFSGDMKRLDDDRPIQMLEGDPQEILNQWTNNLPESFMTTAS